MPYTFIKYQSHTPNDFPFVMDNLKDHKEIDLSRVGVAGISMGGGLAMVLAWKEPRIIASASLISASDFWWDVTHKPPGSEQNNKKISYSQRVRNLVSSIDPWPRLSQIPPKALFVTNGTKDPYIDITLMRRFAAKIKNLYSHFPERFCFKEEPVGHQPTITMRCGAADWLTQFLQNKRDIKE